MKRKEFLSSIAFLLSDFTLAKNSLPSGELQKCEIRTKRVCDRCKYRLGRNIAFEKGVKDAVIDIKNKIIIITYHAGKTNPEILKKYILSLGYDADELKADVYKREEVRDCCLMDITICR